MHPGNSHTADPMRPIAFVAGSEDVAIGVDTMASDHYFGDRSAFDVESRQTRATRRLATYELASFSRRRACVDPPLST